MGQQSLLLFIDMSDLGGIVALVVSTAAGSSVISTVITTYATQVKDRAQIRADVRRLVRVAQSASVAGGTTEADMDQILDDFVRAGLLASLPFSVINLYFTVTRKTWAILHSGETPPPETLDAADRVAAQAFRLVVNATAYPYRTRFVVWRKSHRYMRILIGAMPELDEQYGQPRSRSLAWEREMLRKEREQRQTRRRLPSSGAPAASSAPPTV